MRFHQHPRRFAPLQIAALSVALLLPCAHAPAQDRAASPNLPPVTITGKANRDPVEKSYRRMVRGMDLFERQRALAPNAQLRFKLLPRKGQADLARTELHVLGSTAEIPITVAPDHTFALPRDRKALDENAMVTADRKTQTMTWRTEVRTPGLPPGTRRLGDLRLECVVGMEAGLFSSSPTLLTRIVDALSTTPAYCDRPDNRYYFFADRALFGVTLVNGARREMLPIHRLYAGALADPTLKVELPYCDCEALLDRSFFLPLADRSWPDDTLVVFDYMEDAGAPR